jgi:hypothetical protein
MHISVYELQSGAGEDVPDRSQGATVGQPRQPAVAHDRPIHDLRLFRRFFAQPHQFCPVRGIGLIGSLSREFLGGARMGIRVLLDHDRNPAEEVDACDRIPHVDL